MLKLIKYGHYYYYYLCLLVWIEDRKSLGFRASVIFPVEFCEKVHIQLFALTGALKYCSLDRNLGQALTPLILQVFQYLQHKLSCLNFKLFHLMLEMTETRYTCQEMIALHSSYISGNQTCVNDKCCSPALKRDFFLFFFFNGMSSLASYQTVY